LPASLADTYESLREKCCGQIRYRSNSFTGIMMQPLRLVILERDSTDQIQAVAEKLHRFLNRIPEATIVETAVIEELSSDCADADLIVVLGGDGAILRACRQLKMNQRPIVGINLGRLGFLADLSIREFRERFGLFVKRNYEVVEHLMFECKLIRNDGTSESFLGLNEVAISARSTLEMIEVGLTIDGHEVTTYSCDGLIVATPVGSTAHSLSAGGPAVRQDLPVFIITPICPHTLSNRAVIDHADRAYSLTFPPQRADGVMIIDGQIRRPLAPGDRIEIQKAPVSFKLAKIPGHSFYDVLHEKLGWSGQPRYSAEIVDPDDSIRR
jgi:NAD+ kinase